MLRMVFTVSALILMITPVLATDLDLDGIKDNFQHPSSPVSTEIGDIAVVDTGDGSVDNFITRIGALGYSITTIPVDSGLETLLNYSLVILPVSHAAPATYSIFDGLASDYHTYVNLGGGLWIGQANPYGMPNDQAQITWVPYELTLSVWYDYADCPPVIVDATHCITEGFPNTTFSFPADTVESYGPEWQVLCQGPATGRPSVMFAIYGSGSVLVELCHPSPSSGCPVDDAALNQYVICTTGGVTGLESSSWSSVKTLYR